MASVARAGRPRASSRRTLAEAAGELFLERGYDATSVGDITARAGVARSSFFNYFASKDDVFWSGLDERLDAAIAALDASPGLVRDVLTGLADGFAPDDLALAIVHADAMGIAAPLVRERALRLDRLARAVAARLRRDGIAALTAEVHAGAAAAAVFAAVWAWAAAGSGRTDLTAILETALDQVPGLSRAPGSTGGADLPRR